MKKLEIHQRAEAKRVARHVAAELVCSLGAIKTRKDVNKNMNSILNVIKPEVLNCCFKLGYLHPDPDTAYEIVSKYIAIKIEFIEKNIKKFKKEGKYKGTIKFLELKDIEKAIKWLTMRLISNLRNSLDERYKKSLYLNVQEIYTVEDWNCHIDTREKIEQEIILEQIKNMPREERIKAAKKVWQESLLDLDFDGEDLNQICRYLNISVFEVLGDKTATKIKAEETKLGHKQLFFIV